MMGFVNRNLQGRNAVWKSLSFITALMLANSQAVATTIVDPTNDFPSSYTGPHDADLDVTLFGVTYDPVTAAFRFDATLAGAIDTTRPGFYVIGANTGTGLNNFASIGAPGVIFNQAIVIQKSGATTIGGVAVAGSPTTINGSSFTTFIPLSLLPSTGFSAINYGFNLWPRTAAPGILGTAAISDFAPNNSTISAVPEPAAWSIMLLGFGLVGAGLRFRRRPTARRIA